MRHKCLASFIVFCLFFTITTFISLLEFKIITRPETILRTLAESNIYEGLPKFIETTFSTTPQEDGQAQQTTILIKGLVLSIEPQTVKTEVEKNIPPLLSYFKGLTPQPNATFNLAEVKANLKNNLPSVLAKEMKNLPTCGPGIEPNPQSSGLPQCIPQGTTSDQLYQSLTSSGFINEMVEEIPATFNLNEVKNIDQTFSRIILTFKILNIAFWASLILCLILIGLLALLGRSWWPSIPRWIGLSLVLPSGLFLLFNIISISLPQIISKFFAESLDPEIIEFINPAIQAINDNTIKISFIYSGIIFVIGVILILLSYILPHQPEPKPVPKPQPITPTK